MRKWFWRCILSLRRPFLRRRLRKPHLEHVAGSVLLVTPEVLSPVVFRGGRFFAESIAHADLLPAANRDGGAALLDMGTGTGVCAIAAARRGYRVTGVDINPHAVRCARINVLLNELESAVEIRHGDLYVPVDGEQFDVVLFNPPFFRGAPASPLDMAWRSEDVFARFVGGLPAMLTQRGMALVLLSTDGTAAPMLEEIERAALQFEPVARHDFGNEVMTIYRLRPQPSGQAGNA